MKWPLVSRKRLEAVRYDLTRSVLLSVDRLSEIRQLERALSHYVSKLITMTAQCANYSAKIRDLETELIARAQEIERLKILKDAP